MVFPFSLISPNFKSCKPAIVLKIVVFPTPDGPSKHTISPFYFIVSDTLLILFFSLATKVAFLISRKFEVI